ncbi:MAG: (d)CMP kinase [Verrucomicrobia bacterium]|nr:(d)CMP kinase [Verrucomicrobiota bacterium]
MKDKVTAIDGPSASGKSTVARRLAARTGGLYVDSGALYRAITWKALQVGIHHGDIESVISMLREIKISFEVSGGSVVFTLEGTLPGQELRTEKVNSNVSWIAAISEVRGMVNKWLRSMVRLGPLVVEGRDIGTVVFPDAEHKFYLDATHEERARRRFSEIAGNESVSREEIGKSLKNRDTIDSSRRIDPLRIAPDAVIVDSTSMNADQVVDFILEHVQARK